MFRRTKYFNTDRESPSAPLVNPDNLRKIGKHISYLAYTMNTGKPHNDSIEKSVGPIPGNSTLPKKNFRHTKYALCSDEIKQQTTGVSASASNQDVEYDNLLDYIDQDTDFPGLLPVVKPSLKGMAD